MTETQSVAQFLKLIGVLNKAGPKERISRPIDNSRIDSVALIAY